MSAFWSRGRILDTLKDGGVVWQSEETEVIRDAGGKRSSLILKPPLDVSMQNVRRPEDSIVTFCTLDRVFFGKERMIGQVLANGWVVKNCSDADFG